MSKYLGLFQNLIAKIQMTKIIKLKDRPKQTSGACKRIGKWRLMSMFNLIKRKLPPHLTMIAASHFEQIVGIISLVQVCVSVRTHVCEHVYTCVHMRLWNIRLWNFVINHSVDNWNFMHTGIFVLSYSPESLTLIEIILALFFNITFWLLWLQQVWGLSSICMLFEDKAFWTWQTHTRTWNSFCTFEVLDDVPRRRVQEELWEPRPGRAASWDY